MLTTAPPGPGQRGERGPGRLHGGAEVQGEDACPVVGRATEGIGEQLRSRVPAPDIVDEDVEARVHLEHALDHPPWGIAFCEVCGDESGASVLEFGCGLPGHGDYFGAFGTERPDDREADASARPGDEDALGVEIEIHGALLFEAALSAQSGLGAEGRCVRPLVRSRQTGKWTTSSV
jgi:hypothetical protein